MSKVDLTKPIFHDDDAARVHLETLLWPYGPTCPRCGVTGDRVTKLQGKSTRPGVYKCKDCRKPFTVTVGTVMERSKIPLCKWVLAAQLMASSKKGMSALQLQRMLGTNYETAWFLFHRLRECAIDPKRGPVGGGNKVVEADETYIGGKAKNAHKGKPVPKKAAVFSLVERDGEVRSFHVTNVNSKTLRPIIVKNASRESYLMTDESLLYPAIGREFAGHGTVNHSADEYVRGAFWYTNSVESYFAILKRGMMGAFHNVSEAHLYRYLAEFDFRYNSRDMTDGERADALLAGAKGKRLMYNQPRQTANG
ncbi:IS1595 family transposase [Shumkonia mesophila]|uniref:IS1595 family transposase n=1 Tax=Shumkonia mesophila TaxID=2838854 RepID=UPI002934B576|nr:IS1595 family transposase [Shumkonia mesophila]